MVSRRAHHAAFLAMMDHFEARMRPQIINEKDRFIEAAAQRYENDKTPNFFDLVHKHQESLFGILKQNYSRIIPAFGTLTLAQVHSKSFKDSEEDLTLNDLAQRWIHTEGLKRSKLIADTTEADVLAAISNGLDDGLGTSEIGSAIGDVTGLSAFRSDLIARTETHAAANYAGIESVRNAEEKLGVTMLKSWLPTIDSRTRPAHANMQGSEAIPLDEQFDVDGEMLDRPGDPSGSAENVINCRCALGYEEAQ